VRICLYDTSAVAQPVALLLAPPGGTCGNKACWKHLGANGFRYRDPTGTPDGLTDMKLKVAATGELQLLAKGKGGSLPMPPMPLVAPVTVQLAIGEGAASRAGRRFSPRRSRATAPCSRRKLPSRDLTEAPPSGYAHAPCGRSSRGWWC
jgi:hypothetical protein